MTLCCMAEQQRWLELVYRVPNIAAIQVAAIGLDAAMLSGRCILSGQVQR